MPRASSDERRSQIVAAAGRVVRQRGFAATRMADVSNSLGLSAPLIVYHFGSKDHLMAAVLAAEAEAELDRLEAVARSDRLTVAKMDRILNLSLGRASVADWALWIDAWGEALRSDVMRRHLADLDRRWRRELQRVIGHGVADGSFVSDDPRQAADRIMAILDGYGVQLVRGTSRGSASRVLHAARRAVGRELGVHLGPSRPGG